MLLDNNGTALLVVALAKEGVRDEVEEDVAEQTARRERDHGVERRGLQVGGDSNKDKVGDGRNVERGQDWDRSAVYCCTVAVSGRKTHTRVPGRALKGKEGSEHFTHGGRVLVRGMTGMLGRLEDGLLCLVSNASLAVGIVWHHHRRHRIWSRH